MLEDVHFDFDRSALTDEAKAVLQRNIAVLQAHPEIKLIVEGHTCLHGGKNYNLGLSRRRAEKVKAYLVQVGGIAADRLTVVAIGKARPAMEEIPTPDNQNSLEARTNRRVHFEIVK